MLYTRTKKQKIRVVFDCSATYKGQSLNKQLLQGPDLTNRLVGVLLRFRVERVAFMCDIAKMFHQVIVNPDSPEEEYSQPSAQYSNLLASLRPSSSQGRESSNPCANKVSTGTRRCQMKYDQNGRDGEQTCTTYPDSG